MPYPVLPFLFFCVCILHHMLVVLASILVANVLENDIRSSIICHLFYVSFSFRFWCRMETQCSFLVCLHSSENATVLWRTKKSNKNVNYDVFATWGNSMTKTMVNCCDFSLPVFVCFFPFFCVLDPFLLLSPALWDSCSIFNIHFVWQRHVEMT